MISSSHNNFGTWHCEDICLKSQMKNNYNDDEKYEFAHSSMIIDEVNGGKDRELPIYSGKRQRECK